MLAILFMALASCAGELGPVCTRRAFWGHGIGGVWGGRLRAAFTRTWAAKGRSSVFSAMCSPIALCFSPDFYTAALKLPAAHVLNAGLLCLYVLDTPTRFESAKEVGAGPQN